MKSIVATKSAMAALITLGLTSCAGTPSLGSPELDKLRNDCEHGDKASCFSLSVRYSSKIYAPGHQPTKTERATLLKIEEKNCAFDVGTACYKAGLEYLIDNQTEKGKEYIAKAIPLMIDECDTQKNYASCNAAGQLYRQGRYVEKSDRKSRAYIEKGLVYEIEIKEDNIISLEQDCRLSDKRICSVILKSTQESVKNARQRLEKLREQAKK